GGFQGSSEKYLGTLYLLYPFVPDDVYVVDGVASGFITLQSRVSATSKYSFYHVVVSLVRLGEGGEETLATYTTATHYFDHPTEGTVTLYEAFPFWLTPSAERVEHSERLALKVDVWGYSSSNDSVVELALRRNSDDVLLRLPLV
ncbi:MAG: hypothetical protein ACXQS2_00035, partial [Methermicoccaceae archaeon]